MGTNASGGERFETTRRDGEYVSETVLRALSAAGVDMLDSETVLYDSIDLDALNRLFSRPPSGGADPADRFVKFTAFDRRVRVSGDMRVTVTLLED